MSYYDNTDEQNGSLDNKENKSNKSNNVANANNSQKSIFDNTDNPHKASIIGKVLIGFFILIIIVAVVGYVYFFMIQPNAILKLLNEMPLNKPIPLSNAIIIISNLSAIKSSVPYNLTYSINSGATMAIDGSSKSLQLTGNYSTFMTDNKTRSDFSILMPAILSEYLSKINAIIITNQSENYVCYNILYGSLSGSGINSVNNYSCLNIVASKANESKLVGSAKENLTRYLNGINFTLTNLSLSSYKNNSCVLLNGTVYGNPKTILENISNTINNAGNLTLNIDGKISTCISMINYMPVYIRINGNGALNASTFNAAGARNSITASIYLYINQTRSGTPLNVTQLLKLPGTVVNRYNLTSGSVENILHGNGISTTPTTIAPTTVPIQQNVTSGIIPTNSINSSTSTPPPLP